MPASRAQRASRPALTPERKLIKQLYEALLESCPDPESFDFGPAYEGTVRRRRAALQAYRHWNNQTNPKAVP